MLADLLTRARDSRLVWDLLGPIYNRHIHGALHELFEHLAQDLGLEGNARVLDVGTGPGYMAFHVAERYPSTDVVGIDFSPMQVRAADRLRNRKGLGNCRFMKANAMQLPFDPGSFDAVVSVGSIKHWPDAGRGMREMERVLRPGGLVLISETDREAPDEALNRFLDRFRAWYLWRPLLFWAMRRIVFGRSYSQEQVMALAEAAGFRETKAQRLGGCPYVIVKARKAGREG